MASISASRSFCLFFSCHTFVTYRRCEWTSSLWGACWRIEKKNDAFSKVLWKHRMWEAGSLTFIVTALCSGQPCTRHHGSVLFIVVKSRHAICLPRQPAAVLALLTLCDSLGLKHFMFAPFFSRWHPTKGSHQVRGWVIYKDYQRNMMSKGKL